MNFQFTHIEYLLLLPLALGWAIWWFRKSDVQIQPWRRWLALALRIIILTAVVLAVAGLQWLRPMEGMNVFFLLDRSDSVPSFQQESARRYVNAASAAKESNDRSGVIVFGTEAAVESSAAEHVNLDDEKVLAVVGSDRTDIAGAIRLGTAAFPETGQKRLVLLSDGNENLGDALTAIRSARSLDVTLDVIPLGAVRGMDVSVQKLGLPSRVKKGSTFDAKIFVDSDQSQTAKVRLYRNNEPLGEQEVQLSAGKNLYSLPQQLTESGFYSYSIQLEVPGDNVPQNNQALGFINVRGDPRILLISAEPNEDQSLVAALADSQLEVNQVGIANLPTSLAELQSYDSIFLSNVSAGDLGRDVMNLLESAVRDFGVGLVCIGGDQSFAAGGYRGTPLETTLPVNMELDSKKVLPNGAVVLVMHGMEFNNGNQVARDCAQGVLDALGPMDEMGVILWNGTEQWLFELAEVGNKSAMRTAIAGMNQGDLSSFQGVMSDANDALKQSTANLKHMIVFSDGDPGAPSQELMNDIVANRITVTTVLISGHFGPETMEWIAFQGRGRFYNVDQSGVGNLPQIFVKEAAVILKSAIFEEPFQPQQVMATELTRGIGSGEWPVLRGYVASTPKARAETPLLSNKGDPLLAHWQYGLGRAAAFTSDAKARWARDWLAWGKYRQFWSQIAQWSLRKIENADFTTDVTIDKGEGHVIVEALDEEGDYRNFLNLRAAVVSPQGERLTMQLEQTGPGRYEAKFPTKEVGSYVLNLMEYQNGQLAGAQTVGTSVNYSPEFNAPEPNLNLLQRLAQSGQGRFLDPDQPTDNPFLHDRRETFQPNDLWEWLLKLAVVLFVIDVGVRRIQIEREQWAKGGLWLKHTVFFWKGRPRPAQADESLAALLHRRDEIRARHRGSDSRRPDPDPGLFQPKTEPATRRDFEMKAPPAEQESAPEEQPGVEPEAPASTTSRLLEAKKRAQKRRK